MATHARPETPELDAETLAAFTETLRGRIVTPDDAAYDETRSVWNGLVDVRPALVVKCAGAADVVNALAFADERDLPFSVRGGGHHQSGSSLVDAGVVLDLSEMTSVRVDPRERVARVEPGCRIRDVLVEAQQFGLAAPTGSAGDVGVPGSTLGGGIGWIRRRHGLGIDALRSVDVVTPDGELRRAGPDRNADLFWAVRGGGGNFGVVTSFEFELFEVGPLVAGLGVFYPGDEAEAVLDAYRELTRDAPDEVTTLALVGHVPNLPPIPDDVAGADAVAILGCYAGDVEDGGEALRPFRELAEPLLDMSDPMPYLLLHQLGTMMFPDGRNYSHRSAYVDELSDDVISRVVDEAEAAPSPMSGVGIWHLGGAVSEVGADETAYPWRDKRYMLVVEANWEEGDDAANVEWARGADAAFRDLGAVGAYGGFTGANPRADEDVPGRVYGDNFDRLVEIKSRYDPENALDRNVNVSPADE